MKRGFDYPAFKLKIHANAFNSTGVKSICSYSLHCIFYYAVFLAIFRGYPSSTETDIMNNPKLQKVAFNAKFVRYLFGLLIILILNHPAAVAQTFALVGSTASTSSSSGLSSSTSTGTRNERHTCIYTATELSTAGLSANNVITGIAWDKTGDASYVANDLTIRIWLKHNTATTFPASPTFTTETGAATLVYESTSGTIPADSGWLTYNFNTPFVWNGSDAVQVITELIRPASWTATGFSWRTITSTTNAAANSSAASASPPATLTRTGTRPYIRLEVATTGNDAALTAMNTPVSGAPGAQNINVVLRNTGSVTLTSATISWVINGSTPVVYNWSGSLLSGNSQVVTLSSQTFALGTNTVTAAITGANGIPDINAANNVITKTIETCFPLSGNYTINNLLPSSATNFTSFNDLASRLSSCGVSGNVIVSVNAASGPYAEQVTFLNIPGLSASSTITVNGNGRTVTATTTAANRHIIRLKDLQYFTIKKLKIDMNPASAGGFIGIHIMGSGHHITLDSNEVDMKNATSTLFGAYVASGSETSILETGLFHNLSFTNNKATGGGYGVSVFGLVTDLAANIVISGNQFLDFNSNAVYLRETNGAMVHDNFFNKSAGAVGVTNGIQLAQSANVNGNIYNNYFKMSQTNGALRAIYLFAGTGHKVYNNVITDIQSESGEVTGIHLRTASTAPQVYNNTIAFNHESATTGNLFGIRIETANTGAVLRNNVININQTTSGFKAGIYLSSNSGISTSFNSNNNLLWIPGGNVAGYANVTTPTSIAANLTAWQASGQDMNSVEANPQMYGAALPIPTNPSVADLGVTYGGLTTDIQGNARNLTTPDFGAYEYLLPLPVTLTRFYGERRAGIDNLYWHTASEKNSKGYEIEQSDDGIHFEAIGYVVSLYDGNNNHPAAYSFENKHHFYTGVIYYRLQQIDKNGRSTYSDIIRVDGKNNNSMGVSVYPNPVVEKVNLQIIAPQAGVAVISIVDFQGKEVLRRTRALIEGIQLIELDVNSIVAGTYFLNVSTEHEQTTYKFVK